MAWLVIEACASDQGYAGTTMAQIAQAAGVAVKTVYSTFHTKAAVLSPGVDLERATDLLMLIVGMDVYHALVEGRGRSHEAWVDCAVSAIAVRVFGCRRKGRSQ